MLYAVTYDIDCLHAEVRTQCLRAGFMDRVGLVDGTVMRLPSTTLVVAAAGRSDAARRFMREAARVPGTVTVLRLVRFECSGLYLLSDRECREFSKTGGSRGG
jgi:hypothetical protein